MCVWYTRKSCTQRIGAFGTASISDLLLVTYFILCGLLRKISNVSKRGVGLAGDTAKLWWVQGGNKRVPEQLLINSDARLLKHSVQSVSLIPNGRYSLDVDWHSVLYDYVIIACPIVENSKYKITFNNFPEPIDVAIKYQRTVVTLVRGVLNHSFFNYDSPNDLPNTIFSINDSLFFNSISLLTPVNPDESYNCNTFKVFSKEVLTKKQIDLLFLCHNHVKIIDWLAYPLYDTSDRNSTFVLHDNLFHTNAIEWAASAMEMSAIAGHNAALQVMSKLKKFQDISYKRLFDTKIHQR